ncbi:hypothetical protein ACF3N7_09115 [Cruoricaptor ignavus]|uniref:hypothetical protein n=1 Tax=Cruoricaptor ignavus TaxID=1118202 RepID=UPI00370D34B3
MTRKDIMQALMDEQQQIVERLAKRTDELDNAADLDEDDTIDPEDLSHQDELKQQQFGMEDVLAKANENLAILKSFENQEFTTVEEGSIVNLDEMIVFIGAAIPAVDFNGKKLIGISSDAPLFTVVQGKTVGEKVKLGEKTAEILNIF